MVHKIGSLLPVQGQQPKFAQVYFMDGDSQAARRGEIFGEGVEAEKFQLLREILVAVQNPYVNVFEEARTIQGDEIAIKIAHNAPVDGRRYNAPVVSEVAVIIRETDEITSGRDLILRKSTGQLQRINSTHQAYDALSYPLLFPRGEPGWSTDLTYAQIEGREPSATKLSLMDWNKFYLQSRSGGMSFHLIYSV